VSLKIRRIAAVIIAGIAIAHIFSPSHVQIDWPTITLVIIALILAFFWSEIAAILPNIKRLRLGEAEIEMRDEVAKLHEEVEKVESTPPTPTEKMLLPKAELAAKSAGGRSEASILALAARDKEPALVLLAIEIEKELARLARSAGVPDTYRTIRETLEQLVNRHVLTHELAKAILNFRDVRNKVVHPIRQAPADDFILTSAIDSGIRILRILRSR